MTKMFVSLCFKVLNHYAPLWQAPARLLRGPSQGSPLNYRTLQNHNQATVYRTLNVKPKFGGTPSESDSHFKDLKT